ncbi:hypothetical protein EJ04DRAFT_574922 [Polyplosphaeria fusca]|uniref:Uncharacterized protein n=1 Tax=Polyplosphaeria fusca TaxID=682080 RepID=A0A9P4V666_9PLEO|nr:hypothetical protein EJ04DRAFT_574922 [Polyplosphaeria fusca]
MFKPTARLLGRKRRIPLTTKQTSKGGFYKGSGVGMLGTLDSKARFRVDLDRVRTFVVPSTIHNTNLTPFVSRHPSKSTKTFQEGETWKEHPKFITSEKYLQDFKERGNNSEYLEYEESQEQQELIAQQQAEWNKGRETAIAGEGKGKP